MITRRQSFFAGLAGLIGVKPIREDVANTFVDAERGDRGDIFDADGNRIDKCVTAELGTGRCMVFREVQGRLLKCEVIRPAPLRFVRKEQS